MPVKHNLSVDRCIEPFRVVSDGALHWSTRVALLIVLLLCFIHNSNMVNSTTQMSMSSHVGSFGRPIETMFTTTTSRLMCLDSLSP